MGSWIHKLADRAGIVLWEKPFQNMRASCSTDLADAFPPKAGAEWLGHTVQVADKHYRQVTETHFQKATQTARIENRGVDATSLKSKQSQEKNCAKSCAVHAGNGLQINEATNKKAVKCSVLQSTADACETNNGRTWSLGDFIKPFDDNDLWLLDNPCAAKSVAPLDNPTLSDDDRRALEAVISAWPTLSPETKIAVMQTIESASKVYAGR